MSARFRIVYWVAAVLFLLVTLAEAGFFTDAEGIVVGKKTFRIWGVPTHSQLIIKCQKPMGAETGRGIARYRRVSVSYSVYKKYKMGDRLEHSTFSPLFFRNDESMGFSWDTRWTFPMIVFAFLFFASFRYRRPQPIRHGRTIRYGRYYLEGLDQRRVHDIRSNRG